MHDVGNLSQEIEQLILNHCNVRPVTRGWSDEIEKLLGRGLTPQQILGAAKYALTDKWHANKFCDAGPKYISWKYNDLVAAYTSPGPKRDDNKIAEAEGFSRGMHRQWEVVLHDWDATYPDADHRERDDFIKHWLAMNHLDADKMMDCFHCQREMAESMHRRHAL